MKLMSNHNPKIKKDLTQTILEIKTDSLNPKLSREKIDLTSYSNFLKSCFQCEVEDSNEIKNKLAKPNLPRTN